MNGIVPYCEIAAWKKGLIAGATHAGGRPAGRHACCWHDGWRMPAGILIAMACLMAAGLPHVKASSELAFWPEVVVPAAIWLPWHGCGWRTGEKFCGGGAAYAGGDMGQRIWIIAGRHMRHVLLQTGLC